MADFIDFLATLLRILIVPFTGYAVVRIARRWPGITFVVLLAFIAGGVGALFCAAHEGYSVDPVSRRMTFGSEPGRWCFALGGVMVILGVPALPLVAVARIRNGEITGPVGGQWFAALFGYFIACAVFGAVLYSWLTGIVK